MARELSRTKMLEILTDEMSVEVKTTLKHQYVILSVDTNTWIQVADGIELNSIQDILKLTIGKFINDKGNIYYFAWMESEITSSKTFSLKGEVKEETISKEPKPLFN